jgi:hypothetical protein
VAAISVCPFGLEGQKPMPGLRSGGLGAWKFVPFGMSHVTAILG